MFQALQKINLLHQLLDFGFRKPSIGDPLDCDQVASSDIKCAPNDSKLSAADAVPELLERKESEFLLESSLAAHIDRYHVLSLYDHNFLASRSGFLGRLAFSMSSWLRA